MVVQFRSLPDNSFFYSRVTPFAAPAEEVEQNQKLADVQVADNGIRSHGWLTAFFFKCLACLCCVFSHLKTVEFTNADDSTTYLNKRSAILWINAKLSDPLTFLDAEASDETIVNQIRQIYAAVQTESLIEVVTPVTLKNNHFLSRLEASSHIEDDEYFPKAINFAKFNNSEPYKTRAATARKNLKSALDALERVMLEHNLRMNPLTDADTVPAWQLNKPINELDDDVVIKIGAFAITGKELKELHQSTRVTYDADKLDADTLHIILNRGSQNAEQGDLARYRQVSSDIVMVCKADGSPLRRGEDLFKFRLYTKSAPNLAYNQADCKKFVSEAGIIQGKYIEEVKGLLKHFLLDCKKDGVRIPVLPGIGLGSFMPEHLKKEGCTYFAAALGAALAEFPPDSFEAVIFATPDPTVTAIMESEVPKEFEEGKEHVKFVVSKKSCLDVAQTGARCGLKMGVLNPGDPSGMAGQFWEGGHIALEEMMALFSTMVLSQHSGANPDIIGDKTKYEGINISDSVK